MCVRVYGSVCVRAEVFVGLCRPRMYDQRGLGTLELVLGARMQAQVCLGSSVNLWKHPMAAAGADRGPAWSLCIAGGTVMYA